MLKITTRIWNEPKDLIRNIENAITLGLPELTPADEHDRRMVIAGFAPSLRDHVDEIVEKKARGDLVVCVNGAHDWLIERGIVPDMCVLLDAWEGMKDLVKPHKEVHYFVASQCPASLFDYLKGYRVTLWHSYVNKEQTGFSVQELIDKDGPKSWIVYGGCTAALRCLNLGYLLGYRRFTYFGVDSSFPKPNEHYVGPCFEGDDEESKKLWEEIDVKYGGRNFLSTIGLTAQAEQFERFFMVEFNKCKIRVVGEGLIPYVYQTLSRLKYGQELTDV